MASLGNCDSINGERFRGTLPYNINACLGYCDDINGELVHGG